MLRSVLEKMHLKLELARISMEQLNSILEFVFYLATCGETRSANVCVLGALVCHCVQPLRNDPSCRAALLSRLGNLADCVCQCLRTLVNLITMIAEGEILIANTVVGSHIKSRCLLNGLFSSLIVFAKLVLFTCSGAVHPPLRKSRYCLSSFIAGHPFMCPAEIRKWPRERTCAQFAHVQIA